MKYIYLPQDPSAGGNYRRAIERAGRICCVGKDWEKCEALVLPGGGDVEPWRYGAEESDCRGADPARDALEMQLIGEFLARGRPVLGICRGLQMLNVYFGGTLIQHVEGHSAVGGRDTLHASRIAPSVLRELYGSELTVNSAHHQAADRLGSGLRAVQWAPDGVIEALVHSSLPVWAVQWHPERLDHDGERLLRAFMMLESP
ncbi:MAG: gamma-glutamyl-gamma-aminobutyrate hydrolase family protein [Oscillospiraceae bacterium]|nr:gamma-glutamyl-gamma-aminobutyrate hydrolase family protein [Oscillospiraceae bacterium]